MRRKDGRELVTEHPITAWDMIDVIHGDDLPSIPPGAVWCSFKFESREESWAGDDVEPEAGDFDSWGA